MTFKFNYFQKIIVLKHIKILVFLMFSGLIFSQNNDFYYVSALTGSDSNNGSETAPFETINRAISLVNPGDTIFVMNGTYQNDGYGTVDTTTNTNMNNNHVVTINKSGTAGAYITLKNYPGHTPIIQFDGRGGIVISNDMNYIIIEGFEVVGPAASITYAEAYANREYKVLAASDPDDDINYNHTYFSGKGIWGGYGAHHHIIIRNNIVHDTAGSGIRFNDSDHITIENNEVYNTTWWTSSASSAVVFAETIASSEVDNGTDVKMVMRGNLVYNNWNRIPFYVTQLPDNSGNTNPNYGTANYNSILDGQGLYVTRSDDNYNGTFLFENNVCVNNGKNGINFDNSLGASAIIQNNSMYYNGVHEILQDLSAEDGNTTHRGQNVAGITSRKVKGVTIVNNIVVTRESVSDELTSFDFEESTAGWSSWGPASVALSSNESHFGNKSLLISGRAADWQSPKIDLEDLGYDLDVGQKYKIYVWVKLVAGSSSGDVQLTLRKTVDGNTTSSALGVQTVSQDDWTLISGDYTHQLSSDFLYIRGPVQSEGLADFYIDDFSVVFERNYAALSLSRIDNPDTSTSNDGTKVALNNIFQNGTVAYPGNQTATNFVNLNPQFVNVPSVVNGPVDISQLNLQLSDNSPAIDAGDSAYSPTDDFLGNPRPTLPNAISFTSFENSNGGWSQFGSPTLTSTTETSKSGDFCLSVTNRTSNWYSPKLALDNLLDVGETYTFYVWVKLASGGAGNAQITVKNTALNTYTSVTTSTAVNDQGWTLLTGNFTSPSNDPMFAYVKGPNIGDGVVSDFYIDDFTLVPQGSAEVDFSNIDGDDVVDIGAYEFINTTAGVWDYDTRYGQIFLYPNPAKNQITISKYNAGDQIEVMDLLGKYYQLSNQENTRNKTLTLDVSTLSTGIYLVKIRNTHTNSFQTLKFLKH
jgi:hypothetical protein